MSWGAPMRPARASCCSGDHLKGFEARHPFAIMRHPASQPRFWPKSNLNRLGRGCTAIQ